MTSGWQLMASAPRTSAEGRRLSDSPRRLISIGPAGRPGPRQPARLSAGAVLRELRACPAPGAVRAVRMRSRAEIRSGPVRSQAEIRSGPMQSRLQTPTCREPGAPGSAVSRGTRWAGGLLAQVGVPESKALGGGGSRLGRTGL